MMEMQLFALFVAGIQRTCLRNRVKVQEHTFERYVSCSLRNLKAKRISHQDPKKKKSEGELHAMDNLRRIEHRITKVGRNLGSLL